MAGAICTVYYRTRAQDSKVGPREWRGRSGEELADPPNTLNSQVEEKEKEGEVMFLVEGGEQPCCSSSHTLGLEGIGRKR